MLFQAEHTVIGRMPLFPQATVREEPSFERRPIAWVREHGGPVARAFVEALPAEHRTGATLCECHLSFMKRGWRYRAKGHWHTHGIEPDAPARNKYDAAFAPAIVTIIGDVCLTEVCEGSFELPGRDRTEWDTHLRELIASGRVKVRTVEEGAVVHYGWGDFHVSVPAHADGWRLILSAWHAPGERQQFGPMHRVDNAYSPKWPVSPDAARAFDAYRVTAPPHHPVPRARESGYRLLGELPRASNETLQQETPLFAADPEFARRHGGPLTRAFLDALPEGWHGPGDRVVIDSFLNWLFPGRVPGWDLFHFEPFPAQFEGARAAANWNEEEEHVSCVLSDDSTHEFAVGDVAFDGGPAEQNEYWRFCTNLERRHHALMALVERGSLRLETIPSFTLHAHAWGDFFRALPATRSGFHFRLRASKKTLRPYCNALRNLDCADLVRF